MLPLSTFLKLGGDTFQFRYGLMMSDPARGRYYFIIKDNEFALINRGLRLFMGWTSRDRGRYGLVLDKNPFYFVYVMDLKNPILPTYRYYPEFSPHPLDLL